MQIVRVKFNPTVIQKYFLEKALELLHGKTLDTYRVRIHNPKTIIKELMNICIDIEDGKLKYDNYAAMAASEAIKLIESSSFVKFSSISRKYYLNLLNKPTRENYSTIIHASKIIIRENESYAESLFSEMLRCIITNNLTLEPGAELYEKIDRLLNHYLIELIDIGYSKQYLYKFISSIFCGIEGYSFFQRLLIFKSLTSRSSESFNVIIGLFSPTQEKTKFSIKDPQIQELDKSNRTRFASITNQTVSTFLEEHKNHSLYTIPVQSQDYISALLLARDIFSRNLDILHLGYSTVKFEILDSAIPIGEKEPSKATINPINYSIDGFYRSKYSVYENIYNKLDKLDNHRIKEESLRKVYYGIRYLRIGTESTEIETKFLGYWIGLEYLFSTPDAKQQTIQRIKTYFVKCHALIYFKRNLLEFHRTLFKSELYKYLKSYSNNLYYLTEENTYHTIIKNSTFPILSNRAHYFLDRLQNPKLLRSTIERHENNLMWNLTRIYRLRNEIVHDAASKPNISIITSHLRYYLTFILNSIIDFIIENQNNYSQEDRLKIEDYFILKSLEHDSMQAEGVDFNKLLKVKNPLDFVC